MTKLGLLGFGKVGHIIYDLSLLNKNVEICSIYDRQKDSNNSLTTSNMDELLNKCDVIIDFSHHLLTKKIVELNKRYGKSIVIGTTALDSETLENINNCSNGKIFYATNFSVGIALLRNTVKNIAKKVPNFDIEVVEKHHRNKVDAPSGTAITLAQDMVKARGYDNNSIVSIRSGSDVPRKKDEITLQSIRGGTIVGEHTVGFYGDGEYLELKHIVQDRGIFASTAIDVALWLTKKSQGVYGINDYLDIVE